MSNIQNITLAFPCQEKLVRNAAGEFYCHTCAHGIVDFRCQSAEALQEAIRQAGTRPVCGIFKSSQLSEKFAKYAAAAAITAAAASATMCSTEDNTPAKTNALPMNDAVTSSAKEISPKPLEVKTRSAYTFGIVVTDVQTRDLQQSVYKLNQIVFSLDDGKQVNGNTP